MSIEKPKFNESIESNEDLEIVREELRGALLAGVCGFDETDECQNKWFELYGAKFDEALDKYAKDEDILTLWVENRDSLTNIFHEKLDDLDIQKYLIKKDLAA